MQESDVKFQILATNPLSRAGSLWGPLVGLGILSLPVKFFTKRVKYSRSRVIIFSIPYWYGIWLSMYQYFLKWTKAVYTNLHVSEICIEIHTSHDRLIGLVASPG